MQTSIHAQSFLCRLLHSVLSYSFMCKHYVCVIITEHKPGKSKIWCINYENLFNKDMDYHGIFLGLYYTQYD